MVFSELLVNRVRAKQILDLFRRQNQNQNQFENMPSQSWSFQISLSIERAGEKNAKFVAKIVVKTGENTLYFNPRLCSQAEERARLFLRVRESDLSSFSRQ